MPEPRRFPRSIAELRAFALEHFGITIASALVLITVLHILIVARFSVTTALALTNVADRTQILVSTLTSTCVVLSGVATMEFARQLFDNFDRVLRSSFPTKLAATVIGFTALASGATLVPLWAFGLLALLTLIIAFLTRHPRSRGAKLDEKVEGLLTLGMAVMLTVAIGATLSLPWAPQEILKLSDERTASGFVVGTRDGFTALLVDGDQIEWIRTSTIESRRLCEDVKGSHWWSRPLLFQNDYPKCTITRLQASSAAG